MATIRGPLKSEEAIPQGYQDLLVIAADTLKQYVIPDVGATTVRVRCNTEEGLLVSFDGTTNISVAPTVSINGGIAPFVVKEDAILQIAGATTVSIFNLSSSNSAYVTLQLLRN